VVYYKPSAYTMRRRPDLVPGSIACLAGTTPARHSVSGPFFERWN
jgi:hypothetical protein